MASAAHAAGPLYVSLTFDDGLKGDYDYVLPALQSHGFAGTFYINSGTIGTTNANRQNDRMIWSEITTLQGAGMEIGGHTTDHSNLSTIWADPQYTTDAQRTAAVQAKVCTDRTALVSHGFNPTSFAYPNGGWTVNGGADTTTLPNIVKGCGYSNARTTQGIAIDQPDGHCDLCYAPLSDRTAATSGKPFQPFALRASQARGSQIAREDGGGLPAESGNDDLIPLSTLQGRTQLAIDALQHPNPADVPNPAPSDGGWLILVLHDVCKDANTAPCGPNQAAADRGHSTTSATLNAYLDWLKTQTTSNCVVVKTVQQVMNVTQPGTCPPPSNPGGGGSGGGSTGGGGGSTGGGGGGSGGTTTTPVTTPVDAPVDTPVEQPAPTPPVTTTGSAPSTSAPTPAAPTVRLLTASPRLLAKGIVGFRAVVKAPAGVKRVQFLVNGKVVGTAKSGKFSWSPKAHKGKARTRTVKISVRVIDARGRVATSGTPITLKLRS